MAELIDVMYIEAGKYPRKMTVDNKLSSFQELVGGYIEAVYPYDDNVAVLVNEEGKIENLPYSRALRSEDGTIYDAVAGPMVMVGIREDDFCGLDGKLYDKYEKLYHDPEVFVRDGYRLVVHKTEEFDLEKAEDLTKLAEYTADREKTI